MGKRKTQTRILGVKNCIAQQSTTEESLVILGRDNVVSDTYRNVSDTGICVLENPCQSWLPWLVIEGKKLLKDNPCSSYQCPKAAEDTGGQ